MKNIIDISDHQGVIDWEKVKGQIDGVMIRCCWSYGERNDKQFERNISECNRLGIPCGVYLFSYALNEEEAKKGSGVVLGAYKALPHRASGCVGF